MGSFPPPPNEDGYRTSRHYEFYYPNNRNYFWSVLSLAGGESSALPKIGEEAVIARKQLMDKLKVGVHNIVSVVNRPGRSSRDSDLKALEAHDIETLILNSKSLHTILLPGFSSKFSTFWLFHRQLVEERHWKADRAFTKVTPGEIFHIEKNGRKIRCIIANSTSPLARIGKDTLIKQFKLAFKKIKLYKWQRSITSKQIIFPNASIVLQRRTPKISFSLKLREPKIFFDSLRRTALLVYLT